MPSSDPEPQDHGGVLASIQSVAGTTVIAVFIITFLVQAFQIPSESMENTLLIGDYLLVDKVQFAPKGFWGRLLPYREVEQGDIVVFRYPVRPAEHFVKRVVALPGDRLHLENRQLFVNGQPLLERYTIHKGTGRDAYRDNFPRSGSPALNMDARWWQEMRRQMQDGELVVPEGKFFVLGDNRDESLDSRYWGFVPRENIVGRPLLIYWSVDAAPGNGAAASADGTLSTVVSSVTHLIQGARWNRTFRIVR